MAVYTSKCNHKEDWHWDFKEGHTLDFIGWRNVPNVADYPVFQCTLCNLICSPVYTLFWSSDREIEYKALGY